MAYARIAIRLRLFFTLSMNTNSTINLRPAIEADCDQLAILAMQVWLHTYAWQGISPAIAKYALTELTPESFRAKLQNPDSRLIVAEQGTNLLAMARTERGQPWPDAPPEQGTQLATLYVQTYFARQGIGERLLRDAELYAQQPLWLMVNAQNAKAIAFYQKMGYQKIGTRFFKMDDGEHENHVLLGPR